MKKTVILGATDNPDRYANRAANALRQHGHAIVPVGRKAGQTAGTAILTEAPPLSDVDTVTLYLNPTNQKPFYDYILELKPKRVLFNPGTENPELEGKLQEAGIAFEEACTLVLLATDSY